MHETCVVKITNIVTVLTLRLYLDVFWERNVEVACNSHNTRQGSSVTVNLQVLVDLLNSWKPAKIVLHVLLRSRIFLLLYAEVAIEGGRWLLDVSPAVTSRNLPFFCTVCLCFLTNLAMNEDCFNVRLQHEQFYFIVANLLLEICTERGFSQAYHAGDSGSLPIQSIWDLC